MDAPQTIALSLVSHTNVGKTTLARTLLRRDVGEVRDEAHVTQAAERHLLIESAGGHRLELWDTPGFGDSTRLARRLAKAGNPIGWFMSEVWDRLRDRAFWSSQRAVRHVFEEADVVLYLVNASEAPADAAYLDAELQVLTLLGKPVAVLLNQLGAPRGPAADAAELSAWRARVSNAPCVRDVLPLDAFARCWVQETQLLQRLAPCLPPARQPAFAELCAAWQARSVAVWQASLRALARHLAAAALDVQPLPDAGWAGRFKQAGAALGLRSAANASPRRAAERALAERLAASIRASTDELIALHGLTGRAATQVRERVAAAFAARQPASEGKAAMVGGAVTGALAGLKADVLSGGLTLGGGMLVGGVLGAIGAAGLARGYNLVRGSEVPTVAWAETALDAMAQDALLTYLAVAHFGRGRGDWAEGEQPAFWAGEVAQVIALQSGALRSAWALRAGPLADSTETANGPVASALEQWLTDTSDVLLRRLHPVPEGHPTRPPATTPATDP